MQPAIFDAPVEFEAVDPRRLLRLGAHDEAGWDFRCGQVICSAEAFAWSGGGDGAGAGGAVNGLVA